MNSSFLAVVVSVFGCSGAILTKIMFVAMNRDILNVIFGGINVAVAVKKTGEDAPEVHVETIVLAVADFIL